MVRDASLRRCHLEVYNSKVWGHEPCCYQSSGVPGGCREAGERPWDMHVLSRWKAQWGWGTWGLGLGQCWEGTWKQWQKPCCGGPGGHWGARMKNKREKPLESWKRRGTIWFICVCKPLCSLGREYARRRQEWKQGAPLGVFRTLVFWTRMTAMEGWEVVSVRIYSEENLTCADELVAKHKGKQSRMTPARWIVVPFVAIKK